MNTAAREWAARVAARNEIETAKAKAARPAVAPFERQRNWAKRRAADKEAE